MSYLSKLREWETEARQTDRATDPAQGVTPMIPTPSARTTAGMSPALKKERSLDKSREPSREGRKPKATRFRTWDLTRFVLGGAALLASGFLVFQAWRSFQRLRELKSRTPQTPPPLHLYGAERKDVQAQTGQPVFPRSVPGAM